MSEARRIAIVGGGITAACAASRLSNLAPAAKITLFDQGEGAVADFFGLPSNEAPVYAGVGGMHLLPRRLLNACHPERVHVRRGVRVAGMDREADGSWALLGVSGAAAFHDTADGVAQQAAREVLGLFDMVVLTDVSSSFGGWHRASAGVPEAFAARVRDRVRVPMFSAMVAFAAPLGLPLDGITFGGDGGGVWFAARTQSKPGLDAGGDGAECWTLISTPRFATEEIRAEPMQDAKTGAFKPQEDAYLNNGPAPALLAAFLRHTSPMRPAAAAEPKVLYLQGQRWGSALPAPVSVGGRDAKGRGEHTVELMGVEYESTTPPLVFSRPPPAAGAEDAADFLADDALGLYYAGDFTSRRAPGFEAAALAGHAAAEHIATRLAGSTA